MKSQNFEAYADLKKFNTNIASTWDEAFTGALKYVGKLEAKVHLLDYGSGDGKYFKYWTERGLLPEHILGQHFTRIEARPFKPGLLYKRVQHPVLLHKLFFLCRP